MITDLRLLGLDPRVLALMIEGASLQDRPSDSVAQIDATLVRLVAYNKKMDELAKVVPPPWRTPRSVRTAI